MWRIPSSKRRGPPEYDLATVELWLHKGQESARRVGNLIKKGRGVTGSLIYEHLLKNNMLVSSLGFADGLEIQKKGILVFRKFFNGKGLYSGIRSPRTCAMVSKSRSSPSSETRW